MESHSSIIAGYLQEDYAVHQVTLGKAIDTDFELGLTLHGVHRSSSDPDGQKMAIGIMRRSFPNVDELLTVASMTSGCLAERAGILVDDVLLHQKQEPRQRPKGVRPDDQNINDTANRWIPLDIATLRDEIAKSRPKESMTLYVARKCLASSTVDVNSKSGEAKVSEQDDVVQSLAVQHQKDIVPLGSAAMESSATTTDAADTGTTDSKEPVATPSRHSLETAATVSPDTEATASGTKKRKETDSDDNAEERESRNDCIGESPQPKKRRFFPFSWFGWW